MVIGEAEIQGQVKRAYEAALRDGSHRGSAKPVVRRGADHRQACSFRDQYRRQPSERALGGSGPGSARVLGTLSERHVVILGAGETSELTAQALADQGTGTIFVANRHADRALSLAQRFGGSVVGFMGLPSSWPRRISSVSSTSSPHPIVGA